ncbi:PEP-CTERM sorting domain-containing protein [Rugamonas sp.]|uniref:PEP-CTERM sorting domain-containing protein n=1 Tax=Rugamonas sp. TaxID=1926287 RepID=UPI0025EF6F6D|nr:PEP-CTERM sorting domain-containing protein [Rugamonas sp.]
MKKLLLAGLMGLGLISAASAADLVTNGSFDGGNTGWTITDGAVSIGPLSAYAGCCGVDGSTYPYGPNAAFFGGGQEAGGTLSQTLSTVLNQTYTVTFQYGAIAAANPQTLLVGVENGASYMSGGISLAGGTVGAIGTTDQTHLVSPYTFTFTALGANTTLFFKDTSINSNNTDGIVDSVAVTAAVPEPETYAMLLGGLGLVGFMARRRRQA